MKHDFYCPKCGTGQFLSDTCINCGVVFSKFINRQLHHKSQLPEPPKSEQPYRTAQASLTRKSYGLNEQSEKIYKLGFIIVVAISIGTLFSIYLKGYTPVTNTDSPPKSSKTTPLTAQKSQKRIYNASSIKYNNTYKILAECEYSCSGYSDSIDKYLNQNWRVITSTPKEIPIDDWCTCIGTEYVIEN